MYSFIDMKIDYLLVLDDSVRLSFDWRFSCFSFSTGSFIWFDLIDSCFFFFLCWDSWRVFWIFSVFISDHLEVDRLEHCLMNHCLMNHNWNEWSRHSWRYSWSCRDHSVHSVIRRRLWQVGDTDTGPGRQQRAPLLSLHSLDARWTN